MIRKDAPSYTPKYLCDHTDRNYWEIWKCVSLIVLKMMPSSINRSRACLCNSHISTKLLQTDNHLLDRFGVCSYGLRNMANMHALGPLWLVLHEMNNAARDGRQM